MLLLLEVNLVVDDQDFNRTEVILKVLIINNKMIVILHNQDNEVVGHIEVVIVVIIEVVFVELIEIIKRKIQILILHHRQIQIDVVEGLLLLPNNNNSKINGMLVIGTVKHLFIQEQLTKMNNQ
jgi:hypothetical protein